MKTEKIHVVVFFLFAVFSVSSIHGRPPLKFKDQKFKILQFTDLHYIDTEEFQEKK